MAQIVVDPLEAVEIDEEAGEFLACGVRFGDLVVEGGFEALAIQQAGQVVGDRLAVVAVLGRLQLRDVRHDRQREPVVGAGCRSSIPGSGRP